MKRPYIFSQIPIPLGTIQVEKEIKLWRAVLDQALQDYLHDPITAEEEEIKEVARVWLRGDTDYFHQICERAMLSKREVMVRIEYKIGNLWELYK
jgi:hypothetical protein